VTGLGKNDCNDDCRNKAGKRLDEAEAQERKHETQQEQENDCETGIAKQRIESPDPVYRNETEYREQVFHLAIPYWYLPAV
jgi:hypothetical protein